MKNLLLATNNKGKLREIQALLSGFHIQLVTPGDIGLDLNVVEDGNTYAMTDFSFTAPTTTGVLVDSVEYIKEYHEDEVEKFSGCDNILKCD